MYFGRWTLSRCCAAISVEIASCAFLQFDVINLPQPQDAQHTSNLRSSCRHSKYIKGRIKLLDHQAAEYYIVDEAAAQELLKSMYISLRSILCVMLMDLFFKHWASRESLLICFERRDVTHIMCHYFILLYFSRNTMKSFDILLF